MRSTIALILTLLLSIDVAAQRDEGGLSIIPRPARLEIIDDEFELTEDSRVAADVSVPAVAEAVKELRARLGRSTGYPLEVVAPADADDGDIVVRMVSDTSANREAYGLTVDDDLATISASGRAGLFYGIETLLQLFPPEVYANDVVRKDEWYAHCATIEDTPRFSWRGMHLDVSRHFFPKEFIYTYIDMLAMHKFNTFHWHLVDDQGWRIEIKKWPRLTEVGAWRVDREKDHWNEREPQGEGDSATYGGFYTQEEIRDIVAYASSKNITIVPEIEMPAHVSAALAAYPQFSCTGGPFTVPPGGVWPITDIYCAGNDSTFLFLEDVLTEVMDLFPGRYIHIGGDEATKTEWEQCEKCQARIAQEGLADESELQSYFIRRIEKFLISHGRRLIGWDEILEGGLAPEATVMSWRGISGGIAAARSGHDAIMTPTSNCYFDYYQGPQDMEPLAIGGWLPLSKVYEYDPVPDSLSPEEAKHILGAQANVWTEYIPTPEHAQYMTLPRMAAMAEVVWSPKAGKKWNEFAGRMKGQFHRYKARGYTYAQSSYTVRDSVRRSASEGRMFVELSHEFGSENIRYTLDGTMPDVSSALYTAPIPVRHTMIVRGAMFDGDVMAGGASYREVIMHKALNRTVSYAMGPDRNGKDGDSVLTNGLHGSFEFNDGEWQGFEGKGFEGTIDLGAVSDIHGVSTTMLQKTSSWIFFPTHVEFLVGADTSSFKKIAEFDHTVAEEHDGPSVFEFRQRFRNASGRYIRVKAENVGVCPEWHTGAGKPAWIFLDEIVVE